jgi:uncharacterized Tic20 family protein
MTAVPPTGGQMNADERQWSMFAWIGQILIGFVGPLIIMLTKGNESPAVKANAVEALNFSIWMAIYWVIAFVLSFVCIGFILMPVIIVLQVVFGIIGAMKTNQGEMYLCPLNFYRFVK